MSPPPPLYSFLKEEQHCRYSPPVDKAVDADGQGKDEHEYPKTDGDELLCFSRTASVTTDEEAAFPAV